MRNAIASEFRKLSSTRSAYWLLVTLVGVTGDRRRGWPAG